LPQRPSNAVIGNDRPRLSRKEACGDWRLSTDRRTLVCVSDRAGGYQVSLTELTSLEDCVARMRHIIAETASWVDQRVLDDLRRALRDVTSFKIPPIQVDRL
jgi:hypothetical protein